MQTLARRKETALLKCPVCSGKLDIDVKRKIAICHTCGWEKLFKLKK
jgi:DNA-directed RNA polymerase subunit RPC12/RpoP